MSTKNKKVSYDFYDDYRNLPLNMRAKVNITAIELLEIQKEDEKFHGGGGELGLEEEGDKGISSN